MKLPLVGVDLFHANGRTDGRKIDMMKLIVAFRNVANAYKKFSQ
jgi:hypothetical protein